MSSSRVIRWRIIIDKYKLEVKYIPGLENVVDDSLSRLPMTEEEAKAKELFARHIASTHHLFVSS